MDDFDEDDTIPRSPVVSTTGGANDEGEEMSAGDALESLDREWYREVAKRARWMDLVGDYAGSERFVLDGDSLFQQVLDDELLRLGRPEDPSFQILHALHSMERFLDEMMKRSAVFDVAFWHDLRHGTLNTGSPEFVSTSRALARQLLFSHLVQHAQKMGLNVFAFSGLEDPEWDKYRRKTRPMFVMINDGGGLNENASELEVGRVLTQRTHIFEFLSHGTAVSLLRGSECRDSKIFSFVFEQHFDLAAKQKIPRSDIIWEAASRAHHALEVADTSRHEELEVLPLRANMPQSQSLDDILLEVVKLSDVRKATAPRTFIEALHLFIIHCLILPTLSVSERARDLDALDPRLLEMLCQTFLPSVFLSLEKAVSTHQTFVDCDGRLFASLLRYVLSEPDRPLDQLVGHAVHVRASEIWKSTGLGQPPIGLTTLRREYSVEDDLLSPQVDEVSSPMPDFKLLAFSNPVFDEELSAVHIHVDAVPVAAQTTSPTLPSSQPVASSSTPTPDSDWDSEPEPEPVTEVSESIPVTDSEEDHPEFTFGTAFSDTRHWHANKRAILPKHLGGETSNELRDADAKARMRRLRTEQRFMATLQQLAATLTGASGTLLEQIVITSAEGSGRKTKAVKDKEEKAKDRKLIVQEKNVRKSNASLKKKPTESSADKIRRQHAEVKNNKQKSTSELWWTEQLSTMASLTSNGKMLHLKGISRNEKLLQDWLAVESRLFRLDLDLRRWIDEASSLSDSMEVAKIRDRYTVSVMRVVKELYERRGLTATALKTLRFILLALGFGDYADGLERAAQAQIEETDRPLGFSFLKLWSASKKAPVYKFMRIDEHPTRWQLRLFGQFMDRSMDSKPDARVSFDPDAWQREVLDCLDEDASILVVAPTSAGKTFISFYAMEKVLRESDDGVLIYVAPTKALVNQVAAEVYARFSKGVNGRAFWSIHTRDFRVHDSQKCQIMVTVPEILTVMLLSPPLARTWTPRIKRIILDEIHTIGQQEGGAVWEQIILLAPCPIIGLSATVGEPELFNTWLSHVQKTKGFNHRFIHHPHRYSHLRKFAYFPQLQRPPKFTGLERYQPSNGLKFIHPISALGFGVSMPPDFSLEAADLLGFHDVIAGLDTGLAMDINPERFFHGYSTFLTQKDILRYEVVAKEALNTLIAASDPLSNSSPLRKVIHRVQDPVVARTSGQALNTPPSPTMFLDGLIPLLADLDASNDLPALLFNFDRRNCERMAEYILETLQDAEDEWRANSVEWKRKLERWEDWKSREKERARALERIKKQDKEEPQRIDDRSWESTFDPDDPSPQFSFAAPAAYQKTDLEEDMRKLEWRSSVPRWALKAIWRGVGVHHSGMHKHYRSLVERLFRIGFLRVVICTGTLSLGINAPTKTSVFCGDSPFLTALMYRQCAGRAGRRGYDLLGRVIFYALPLDRIHRLILSKLPRLMGSFPLSSTLSLRLFNLLHGSGYAKYATDAIQSILRLPQISFGSEIGKEQVLHHLRFSIDFLRHAHLLDHDGYPMNLFGIASHLYYQEPSNLALVTLLQSGVVHEICGQKSFKRSEQDFMLLACHLFGRRYLPDSYTTARGVQDLVRKGPSIVVLPPLDSRSREVLTRQQQQILRIFTAYAVTFATQHSERLSTETRLPLSKADISGDDARDDTPFVEHLERTCLRAQARSSFVANSGHTDSFRSISELANTVRQGIHINEHAIPSFEKIIAISGQSGQLFALNAHIYDFYKHGQVAALARMNGIRRGDIWYLLQDFSLTLATIRGDLENLLTAAGKAYKPQETSEDASDVVGGSDSGYQTLDPAEADDVEDLNDGDSSAFKRPPGVSERDWRVYEVVNAVVVDFTAKFKAMWA